MDEVKLESLFSSANATPTLLSGKDKSDLNKAVTNLVLSSLRPYELANEPFLRDLVFSAMKVGARIGGSGVKRLKLDDSNKLISGDGVRKNLNKVYDEHIVF